MVEDFKSWCKRYENLRKSCDFQRQLVEEANFLFESNEDLENNMVLIGGLAVQEFYSPRRVRATSDIDLVASEKLVERLKERGYIIYYNKELDKYSARQENRPQSYVDVYPRRVGYFEIDEILFEHAIEQEGYSLRLASPEDLTIMKLVSFLYADRGRQKHLVDICSMLANPEVDLNLKYLRERFERKLSQSLYFSAFRALVNPPQSVLQQFSRKERRIIMSELERITNELYDLCFKTEATCKKHGK